MQLEKLRFSERGTYQDYLWTLYCKLKRGDFYGVNFMPISIFYSKLCLRLHAIVVGYIAVVWYRYSVGIFRHIYTLTHRPSYTSTLTHTKMIEKVVLKNQITTHTSMKRVVLKVPLLEY